VKHLLAVALFASTVVATGCASGDQSTSLDDLRNADAPYYYVGDSFDGLKITHVERYQRGVANLIYGDCKARSDEGCPPPLGLQHRLCHGKVTVVIFANERLAHRAADALRPLSQRASAQHPQIAFNRSPRCKP
jgi:hypothetical protein